MSRSNLERKFNLLWTRVCVRAPRMVQEFRFHPKRKWRFDFCSEPHMVAVEIEGGIWNGGRHTTGHGFVADCEKYNEATMIGWRVIRLTPKQLNVQYLQSLIDWMNQL